MSSDELIDESKQSGGSNDPFDCMIQRITISTDLGREGINELGRRSPYYRFIGPAMENRVDWERPAKEDLFLLLACLSSLPSPDAQTQCGCLITTLDNRVLGTGYNGFPRGVVNERIPNTRPDKYPWVSAGHSERNAVNNCAVSPRTCGGGIAYVSGNCCFDCTCHLWNNGVEKIYEVVGFSNPVMCQDSKDEELKRQLQYEIALTGKTLEIIKVTQQSIGKIFRREQLIKILRLFAQTGFDYELIGDFEKRIFA